jgi:hypothetical protein
MHRASFAILLQEQGTRAFRKIRVLLDENARSESRHNFPRYNSLLST